VLKLPTCPDQAGCRVLKISFSEGRFVCFGALRRPHVERYSLCLFNTVAKESVRILLNDADREVLRELLS
jgi:hypothetical protein